MLTKDDLLQIRQVIREEVHKEISNELVGVNQDIKGVSHELQETNQEIKEINQELKQTRQELKETSQEIQGINQELKEAREDIKTVDMKVELVNKRVDSLHEATVDGFGRVLDTVDELNDGVVKRVKELENLSGIRNP